MAIENKEYCGTIVLEVDGKEHETISVDTTVKISAKLVKTMNSKKRALGKTCGTREYDLKLQVPVPLDGEEPDWDNMENATLKIYPACGTGGKSEQYVGCFTVEVGSKYKVEGEAVRDITMHALDKQVIRVMRHD